MHRVAIKPLQQRDGNQNNHKPQPWRTPDVRDNVNASSILLKSMLCLTAKATPTAQTTRKSLKKICSEKEWINSNFISLG